MSLCEFGGKYFQTKQIGVYLRNNDNKNTPQRNTLL